MKGVDSMGNTAYSIRWLKPQNLSKAAQELLSIDNGSVVALRVATKVAPVEGNAPCNQGNLNRVQETPSRMGSKSVNEHHSKENVRQETVLPSWTTIQVSPGRDLTLKIKAELSKRLSNNKILESLQFIEMRRYRNSGNNPCIDCCLYKYVIKSVPVRAGQGMTERKMLITSFNGHLWYSDPDKIEWRYLI
jgi:hypothetical protein